MDARVLIVEDDPEIAELVCLYLENEGMTSVWKDAAEGVMDTLAGEKIDLIILDINLPKMDGYEVLRKIRGKYNTPVIIVSARQSDSDMIMGFGVGADDYVVKPFSPNVLVARIRSMLIRREELTQIQDEIVEFGPFRLNKKLRVLEKEDELVNLSPREMDILLFLANSPQQAFSQEDIYKEIWGNNFGDMRTVSVHIKRLRVKLGEDP